MAETVLLSSAEKRKSGSQHNKATKIEYDFTWKIDNFAFKSRVLKNGQCLISEPFSANGSKDVQWQLICYPKGNTRDLQGFGCFVEALKFCGPKLRMETSLSILDTNGTVLYTVTEQTTFIKYPASIGRSNIFLQKDLLEKYVKQDSLTLNCKLTYEVENISFQAKVPRLEEPEDCITRQLGNLFNTGRMSDVTFVLGTENFKAHKNSLSARSQVFADMFENNEKVSSINPLKIEDCEPEAFRAMLSFLYTDEMEETEEMAKELLPLAIKYQIRLLQNKCQEIVLKDISTENCAEMLLFAEMQGALLLKEHALDYFRRHSGEVIKTAGWKVLRENHTRLVVETLESLAS